MNGGRTDRVSLVAGVGVIALAGVLLLLDQDGDLDAQPRACWRRSSSARSG